MAKGIDVSHYQGEIDWKKVASSGVDFAIQKCTEGLNYYDKTYQKNKNGARDNGIIFGSYHFARGNDPIKEADYFVKLVEDIRDGELLALDYEINLANASAWCKVFLDRVYELTGVRPLLYTGEARVKSIDWSPVVKGNYGLWIAKYPYYDTGEMKTEPVSGQWPFISIFQYSSKGKIAGIAGNVDLDWAYMNKETLKKYGKQGSQQPIEKTLIHPVQESSKDPVYITQKFGENPGIYKRFGMKGHNGIDYRVRFWDSPLGHRYIVAAKDGKVIEVKDEGKAGYGKYVRLEHDLDGNGNEQTIYGHLSKQFVKVGDRVKQGQRIGLSGNTGFSTGPHLHFGLREKGWKKEYPGDFKGYSDPMPFIR